MFDYIAEFDRRDVVFPKMAGLKVEFDKTAISDIPWAVASEMASLGLSRRLKPGNRVAITAGSRGIAGISAILATVCRELKLLGALPFVVPAMGSHGGATAHGQVKVLNSMGITEESLGAPIVSSMETVLLGELPEGVPVYADDFAAKADFVVVVNRIKAHTKFKAPIESGLMKMLAVGLGKHEGAKILHRHSVRLGMYELVTAIARKMIATLPVLFGLGIIENAYRQVHSLKALEPSQMEKGEEELLLLAKQVAPKLPFKELDLLIVDRIGKDISGTGMDTNVTGRNRDILGDFTTAPRVKRIFVRDLTQKTEGNALGIGFADFTTDRLVSKIDINKTFKNALTGVSPEKAAIPIHFPDDRQALAAAMDSLGCDNPQEVKVLRIRDTLHIENIRASEGLLQELPSNVKVVEPLREISFDEKGNMD